MTRNLTTLGVWSPSLLDFRHDLNRMFEGLFDASENHEQAAFSPRANFAETDDAYEVTVDVPGIKAEDLNIEFKEGRLWITGKREQETEVEDKKFHRVERSFGQFRRVVALGEQVDAENIGASYKDGVLTVTAPKVAAAQPKRIEVSS